MLIPYRLRHASTFMSGLRSEYFNPPRSALVEPGCKQLRDVPEKQLHFHMPQDFVTAEEGDIESSESVAGIGQTHIPSISSQLSLSRMRLRRKRPGCL